MLLALLIIVVEENDAISERRFDFMHPMAVVAFGRRKPELKRFLLDY
jgi:hypothetical protein